MLELDEVKEMMRDHWIRRCKLGYSSHNNSELDRLGAVGGGLRPSVYHRKPESQETLKKMELIRSGLKAVVHSKVSSFDFDAVSDLMWSYAGVGANLVKPFIKGDDLIELMTFYLSSFEPMFSCITIGEEE